MTATTEQIGAQKRGIRWTIAHKIGGLASVLILFILLLLLNSVFTLRGLQAELKEIAELDVPLTELTNRIEIEQLEQQITMDQVLRLARRSESEQNDQKLRDAEERLKVHSTALDLHIELGVQLSEVGFDTNFKSIFDGIHAALLAMQQDAKQLHVVLFGMVETIDSGAIPSDQAIDVLLVMGSELDEKMLTLIERIERFTEKEINVLEQHERTFFLVNSSLGASGVLLGIILSAIIIIGIRTSLSRLTQQVSEVSDAITENREISDASVQVDSSDEIGSLAVNLAHMIDNLSTDFQKRDAVSRHLMQVATTDQLTGAVNRLKWEEKLAWEIQRIKRSRDELSMIFFDIDYFKKVNDTFGHDAGDQVLIEVVKTVSGVIRQSDTLYRMGGEEFAILTPFTRRDQVATLADKVRQSIENQTFETVGKVTVSMGCSQFNKRDDEGANMLKRADEALYQAKKTGRNKVCVEEVELAA